MLSSFLVPIIYAAGAFLSVHTYSKWKKVLSFREGFGRAFMPMFVAGALSIFSIYAFITFISPETKVLLNYQYVESYKESLQEEYTKAKAVLKPDSDQMKELETKYAEGKERVAAKVAKHEDMFSAKNFAFVFAGYCVYFMLLSLFFGTFFRTKLIEREEYNL